MIWTAIHAHIPTYSDERCWFVRADDGRALGHSFDIDTMLIGGRLTEKEAVIIADALNSLKEIGS